MANAYTTPSDVFSPQVVGQAIKGYLYNNVALLGSGYIGSIPGAVWSAGGNQVTFPKYTGFTATAGVASSANAADGTKVDSKKVTVTTVTADCVNRILSIAVDKVTLQNAYTDMDLYNMIISQIGEQIRNEIDLALITEAATTTLTLGDTTTPVDMTYDNVVDAKMLWGDKAQNADAAMIVHSNSYGEILKLADIKDASKFGIPTSVAGEVPVLAGMPVFVSDNITFNDSTADSYTNLIVRRNALRFGTRSEAEMEIKTEPGNTMRYLDTDFRYIVDLEQSAQLGVIKMVTTAA